MNDEQREKEAEAASRRKHGQRTKASGKDESRANRRKESERGKGKEEGRAIFERLRPYDAGKPDAGKQTRRTASTSGGNIGGSIPGSIPAPNARNEPFSCIRRKYRQKKSRGWFTFEKPPRPNIEKAVHVLYRVPIFFDFLCRSAIIIQAFCINDIENTFSIFLVK